MGDWLAPLTLLIGLLIGIGLFRDDFRYVWRNRKRRR